MMTILPLLLLCVVLIEAQPTEKGMFQHCDWRESNEDNQLYHVTCKPGEITNPAAGNINVRTRVIAPSTSNQDLTLPIHTLDVDLSIDAGVGIEVTPDFLNINLKPLKTLILRGDKAMHFSESEPSSTHELAVLEVHNSIIEEIPEYALKGFDNIVRVSFTSSNITDILENAFTDHKILHSLTFTNCILGEFETMAIVNNPSLNYVSFEGNQIDEFSRESIVDTKEPKQNQKCSMITLKFINNIINKIDKEAIKSTLVEKLTFTGNKVVRMKSMALRIDVGGDGCQSGEVNISNNEIQKVDEKGFAIVEGEKASKDATMEFTDNVIIYSKDPFFPSSFDFSPDHLTVKDNAFPCRCENSGHSWFVPALDTAKDPLHDFYKQLWSTGSCFEDENNIDIKQSFTQSSAANCHDLSNIADATPDPAVTQMPPIAEAHDSNKQPSAASSSQISSMFVSLCVLFVCVSAM